LAHVGEHLVQQEIRKVSHKYFVRFVFHREPRYDPRAVLIALEANAGFISLLRVLEVRIPGMNGVILGWRRLDGVGGRVFIGRPGKNVRK
jgi:hypothetical protein